MKNYILRFAAAAFIFPLYSAQASVENDAFLDAEKEVKSANYQEFKSVSKA